MTALTAPESEPRTALAALATGNSVGDLLKLAIEKGASVEQLDKLVSLYERMDKIEAGRQFSVAMARFQAECPSIKKGSTAKITKKDGTPGFAYTYAELDDIARAVNPILAKYGLSYSWDTEVTGGNLTVTCTVRHEAGHSIASKIMLPIENAIAMNPQQKVGAAQTYAERRSLSAALGLTTTNDDVDAQADPTPITHEQALELEDLVAESGADMAKFLHFMVVKTIGEIRSVDFLKATTALDQIRRKKAAKP